MRFKYRQVEAALAALFDVDDKRFGAFKARVRHLRNLGIPTIPKAGSGTHAQYSRLNAFEMALTLELQHLGKSPRRSAELAGSWSSEILRKSVDSSVPLYVVLLPGHNSETDEISLIAEGSKELLGVAEEVPSIGIVNASQLVHGLERCLNEARIR
jgi:hypothetical protein